jgi:chemotaxis protein histidine kinase CheA
MSCQEISNKDMENYVDDFEITSSEGAYSVDGAITSEQAEGMEATEIELDADDFQVVRTPVESSASAKQMAYAESKEQSSEKKEAASDSKKDNQKIIRTANMEMEVEKYDEARAALGKLIEQFDARIEKEAESRHSYRVQNQFTIRVAPEKLDDLITAISEIGIDIDNKSINSKNVTRQYVDLETRLASKRAVIKRYRDILKTAKTIKDILNVEEHLRRVVEEVESMEGQLRVLKDQVGESTLHLTMYESFESPNVKKKTFWNRMGKALSNGWRGGQEFLIGMVSIWPFWIIAGGLFWVGRRAWKRRKARKK